MKFVEARVERKHAKGCRALKYVREGTWKLPWACGEHVFLTSRGTGGGPNRRGTNTSWIRFRCNVLDCDATVVVRVDSIMAAGVSRGEERKR